MSKIFSPIVNAMIHKTDHKIFFSPNPNTILNISRVDKISRKEEEITFMIRGEFEYSYKYYCDSIDNAEKIMNKLRDALNTRGLI